MPETAHYKMQVCTLKESVPNTTKYLVQSWRQSEHVEQCLAVQRPVNVGGGQASAAAEALAPTCHAERCHPGTRWAQAKTAERGWR